MRCSINDNHTILGKRVVHKLSYEAKINEQLLRELLAISFQSFELLTLGSPNQKSILTNFSSDYCSVPYHTRISSRTCMDVPYAYMMILLCHMRIGVLYAYAGRLRRYSTREQPDRKVEQRFCFNLRCFSISIKERRNYYLLLCMEVYLFTGSQLCNVVLT